MGVDRRTLRRQVRVLQHGADGVGEPIGDRRADLLEAVDDAGVQFRGGLRQQMERLGVLLGEAQVGIDAAPQCVEGGLRLGHGLPQLAHHRLQVVVEHLHVDLCLAAGEVPVEHRLGDAGPVNDLRDLGLAVALLAEDLDRGEEQAEAPLIPGKPHTHGH